MESNADISERLIIVSEEMAADIEALQSGDAAEESVAQSADDARKILRWLKNLQSTDHILEEWLDGVTNAESLKKLIRIYLRRLRSARKKNAAIMRKEVIQDAVHASASLTLAVMEYTLRLLPENHAKIAALNALIAQLPKQAELRMNQSTRRIIETLELGMDRAAGKTASSLPLHEQLAQSSQRIHATAHKLQSIDTLPQPAREESIELAREILRRLRNLSFTDKTMIEIIDTGRPEEKATLAKKIEEMLDIYKNLLSEAAQITPGILRDERVKEASDAASTFDHAIKLMAAREMPNSMAATQQIGAEATQQPAAWKKMAGHTLERLLKSLQAGVEQAASAIEQEQAQQQQRAEEQNQENKEAAQAANQQHGRKARRRRRSSSGGLTKTQARRNAADLNGDGIADNLQGLNIRGTQTPIIVKAPKAKPANSMGLKDDALAAVQKLGKELSDIGKQAKNIPPITVTKEIKIVPDDKGFAGRNKDDQDRDKNKPQGPRV